MWTSYEQLTITNSCYKCFPWISDGSFKHLRRCSWQNEWFKYISWHCLAIMMSHSQLTIVNLRPSSLPKMNDGPFKCPHKCSWWATPGHHDSSNGSALTLSCHIMTSHSQLTIANWPSGFLPPIDDGSYKCLKTYSWLAVPRCHDSSECYKEHTLT